MGVWECGSFGSLTNFKKNQGVVANGLEVQNLELCRDVDLLLQLDLQVAEGVRCHDVQCDVLASGHLDDHLCIGALDLLDCVF